MKHLLSEWPPLSARGWTGLVGGTVLAALALARGLTLVVPKDQSPRLLLSALLNVTIWMTLIQFCIAYVAWFAALERLPASVAAIGTLAVPVISVIAAAVALHEPLGIGEIAALLFTLLGGGAGDAILIKWPHQGT
jgi:drug/metabolite transporter (DMT)-like permease